MRSDIREGKSGTPLTLTLTVVNTNSGCAPVAGANVEIWQCDATGNYSQYGTQTSQTYLRGIQTTDGNGQVTFTTIYPGWYPGRTTHIHCKVHLDRRTVLTTQLYFDDNLTEEINRTIQPYTEHAVRDTRNDTDSIYADVGLVTTQRSADGYLAAINLGLDL